MKRLLCVLMLTLACASTTAPAPRDHSKALKAAECEGLIPWSDSFCELVDSLDPTYFDDVRKGLTPPPQD